MNAGNIFTSQQSLIKGTKEGIERVSLTAQVRGLQAQKEDCNRTQRKND